MFVLPKMSVLLTTEGTYPFHQGGVSTWCDMLINRLDTVQYTIVAILTDPFVTQKFTLPPNVKLTRIPLWGTDEPSEHLDVRFSSTYLAKQRTTNAVVTERFLPIFDELIVEILSEKKDAEKMGHVLIQLYEFFQEFDYKVAFKSSATWDRYKVLVQNEVERPGSRLSAPDVYGLIQSLGWVYRFFNIVNTKVPETTVSHSSAAAFCGIPCVIAKLKYGTPFLLTEHGVYMREQYLSLSKRGYSSFLNSFLVRMIRTVTDLNYYFADQISPVCEYNTRWERRLTNRHQRIRVIYNGVDHRTFTKIEPRDRKRPTVVTVARIDPIKDLHTLIRAASEVKREIPDVRFLVYGSITVPSYYEDCVNLIKQLSLEDTLELVGHTSDMAAAYDLGDIVVQTSISEAFPYSVVEAMFAAKPIVSTDVGGIPEAIGNTGFLVNPGDVLGLARMIVQLLEDREARLELGQEARRRALNLFTLDKCLDTYLKTYIRLAVVDRRNKRYTQKNRSQMRAPRDMAHSSIVNSEQLPKLMVPVAPQLATERAFAFLYNSYPLEAARYLRMSVRRDVARPADVVKLQILAKIYEKLGLHEESKDATSDMERVKLAVVDLWQRLSVERALAFAAIEEYELAIKHMSGVVDANMEFENMSTYLLHLSRWCTISGRYDLAAEYRLRAEQQVKQMSS